MNLPGDQAKAGPDTRPDLPMLPVVHVFIPYETRDGRLQSPSYDTPSYRAELDSWFQRLNLEWHWKAITLDNLSGAVEEVQQCSRARPCLVFNLCDGDEVGGYPGLSVVRALEQAGLPFTGASSEYYAITTGKTDMKDRLLQAGVPTPPFLRLRRIPEDLERLEGEVGFPAIIKPESCSASVGITLRSLVHDAPSVLALLERLTQHQEWGRWVGASGVFAERFVEGPEFTVFVVADRAVAGGVRALPAAERVFHSALPPRERFLSYDRYWAEYGDEPRVPDGEPFYRYAPVEPGLRENLADLAIRAFVAVSGAGYGRVDIRMEASAGKLFVLEVNSNCGLSCDLETSVGRILHLAGISVHELVSMILRDALDRFQLSCAGASSPAP